MESKGIRFLLIAILVALVLLLIPAWGMFLSGMRGESGTSPAKTFPETGEPITNEPAADKETPVSSVTAEPTDKPFVQAAILGEPDAEGWIMVSLPLFKGPVMARPSMKGPHISHITVKVSSGMEIMAPALCAIGRGGRNGRDSFILWKNLTENQMGISIDFEKIDYIVETGTVSGETVLGTFRSDGEADIMTLGLKPQKIAQTDIDAWFNTALEMVLGE